MKHKEMQCARIGNYNIIKLLGSGQDPKYCKVKLGFEPLKSQYFAIKIIKHDHPHFNKDIFIEQMSKLIDLEHPNLVKIYEYFVTIDYVKKNGTKYPVAAIVMEYLSNGELYTLVLNQELSEEMARTYFQILRESNSI